MITIKAWKKDIAQLVEYKGVIKFKYLDSNNLDFSPIKMPIKNRQVYNFLQKTGTLERRFRKHLNSDYSFT